MPHLEPTYNRTLIRAKTLLTHYNHERLNAGYILAQFLTPQNAKAKIPLLDKAKCAERTQFVETQEWLTSPQL